MPPAIQSDAYAEKQLSSRSRLIRWSHQRRFEVAVGRTAAFAGGRLLDYGCGDATCFNLLSRSASTGTGASWRTTAAASPASPASPTTTDFPAPAP